MIVEREDQITLIIKPNRREANILQAIFGLNSTIPDAIPGYDKNEVKDILTQLHNAIAIKS